VSYWLTWPIDDGISIPYSAAKKHLYLTAKSFIDHMERQFGALVVVYTAYPDMNGNQKHTVLVISHL